MQKIGKKFIFILIGLIFSYSPLAIAGNVTLSVSGRNIQVGENVEIELNVEGDLEDEPIFPETDGMTVSSSGKSSNVSIINGDISRSVIYKFSISFSKPGKFKIPSITLNVDDKDFKTQEIEVNVSAVTAYDQDKIAEEKPFFFIKREVSTQTPYVGQPVTETIKIYRRIDWNGASRFNQDNSDFKYYEIKGTKDSREQIAGTLYGVTTLERVFVPLKEGAKELGTFGVEVQYQDPNSTRRNSRDPFGFFRGGNLTSKRIMAPQQTIGVNGLPLKGRPSEFSNFAGDIKLSTNLSENTLKTGDTATLTITAEGSGWISSLDLKAPKLDENNFKVYPDRPETNENIGSNGITGSKSIKFAIVPVNVGEFDLGEYSFSFFNTKTKKYETQKVSLGKVSVSKGESTALTTTGVNRGATVKRSEIESGGNDVFDIKRMIPAKSSKSGISFYLFFLGFVLLVYSIFSEASINLLLKGKSKSSKQNFLKLRSVIKKCAKRNDVDGIFKGLSNYLSLEHKMSTESVTYADIERYLVSYGLRKNNYLLTSMKKYEEAKYSNSAPPSIERDVLEKDLKEFKGV